MSTKRSGAQRLFAKFMLCCVAGTLAAATLEAGGPPFAADLAAGREMPLPWGIGLTWYDQSQDYAVSRLALGIPGFGNLPVDQLKIDNDIQEVNLKLDVWLFPFLNVFAVLGQVDGSTDVDFRPLMLPIPLEQVTIDYDGDVYGGGVTLAFGGDVWFGSLTGVFTQTDLKGDFESDAQSLVVMPRVGLHGRRGSVWVGAMYLDTEENHKGTVTLPFLGPVPFEVELIQKDDWNALVGLQAALTRHWTLEVEGGFGARDSLSATLDFRF
ncbi:MAG: hypothetical protein AB7G12_01120 [Thermoanaerobaculia bacterium]